MVDDIISLNGTQKRLRASPTAGIDSEHSPLFRRQLSAGYKGYLQGNIAGGTLYGIIGMGAGVLVGVPAMFLLPGLGAAALMAVPALGLIMGVAGAHSFGNIGSLAAVSADALETKERREHLFERLKELPGTPEYDEEEREILELLNKDQHAQPPETIFHWKAVAVGAALGLVVAGAFLAMGATGMPLHFMLEPLLVYLGAGAGHATLASVLAGPAGLIIGGLGATVGAAVGAVTLGLDRGVIRQWFDAWENVVYDPTKIEKSIAQRVRETERLGGTPVLATHAAEAATHAAVQAPATEALTPVTKIPPETVASAAPLNTTTNYQHVSRLAEIQQAMKSPTT